MKLTNLLGLTLMDAEDQLSARPLNENAQKLDEVVGGIAQKLGNIAMMAYGSYVGNGNASVTIQTPGFKPEVVFMRQKRELGVSAEGIVYSDSYSVDGGWAYWAGEKSLDTNIYAPSVHTSGGASGLIGVQPIWFTAEMGSLTWTTDNGTLSALNKNINNTEGVTYEWVAFGRGEVNGWA